MGYMIHVHYITLHGVHMAGVGPLISPVGGPFLMLFLGTRGGKDCLMV